MSSNVRLPRSKPEEQGILSSGILAFLDAAEKESREKNSQELHSFMLVRHGYVVAEGWWSPYSPERPHMLFSLSKSFTSTAVGLAVSEGLLSVDDYVVSFFPEDLPEKVEENLGSMQVKHLLSMGTGHVKDTIANLFQQKDGNWAKGFLSIPVDYVPGTHFVYNTGATYMLSAIVQKVTGQKLIDYLKPRLFEPLGIENPTWETCPRGINTGGFGLSIKTEDIAKFGQMYLQKGIWEGKQLIPEKWVVEATESHISNESNNRIDWQQGYGYQFWRCRYGAYRGDGAFGQFCIVMPEQDTVIAITGGVGDMQTVMNLVWEHLLPSMSQSPLAMDDAAQNTLEEKLSSLELAPPDGKIASAAAQKVSGKSYIMEKNSFGITNLSFDFAGEMCTISINTVKGDTHISCGIKKWVEGEVMLPEGKFLAVTGGSWVDEDNFKIAIRMVETPFYYTVICSFDDDKLHLEADINLSFSNEKSHVLCGQLKS